MKKLRKIIILLIVISIIVFFVYLRMVWHNGLIDKTLNTITYIFVFISMCSILFLIIYNLIIYIIKRISSKKHDIFSGILAAILTILIVYEFSSVILTITNGLYGNMSAG